MSHPNVDMLKKGYGAFQEKNLEALKELFADDIVWHVPGNNRFSGDYKGQEEVFNFFMQTFQETGGTLAFDLDHFLADDERGVVMANVSAERAGKKLMQTQVHVFRLEGGKVMEFWNFTWDPAAADDFWS